MMSGSRIRGPMERCRRQRREADAHRVRCIQVRRRVGSTRVVLPTIERQVRDGLSGGGWRSHEQHRLRIIPGRLSRDQSARKRTACAHGHRLEPDVASADRCLLHVQRQGFPARTQCRTDDLERGCAVGGSDTREIERDVWLANPIPIPDESVNYASECLCFCCLLLATPRSSANDTLISEFRQRNGLHAVNVNGVSLH